MGKYAVYIAWNGKINYCVFEAICNFHGMSVLAFALPISTKFVCSEVTKQKKEIYY